MTTNPAVGQPSVHASAPRPLRRMLRIVSIWALTMALGLSSALATQPSQPPATAHVAPHPASDPRLAALPDNTALDLGRYTCTPPAGDTSETCAGITDYSGMVYDFHNHQLLMFGGGHATTFRDDVDVFSFNILKWSSAYTPTPCSEMLLANRDLTNGAWQTSGHPMARHTYDLLVMAADPPQMIMLTSVIGSGYCIERPNGDQDYYISGRIAHYNPLNKQWAFSAARTYEENSDWSYGAAELDPVSNKIVVVTDSGLWTYDPRTQERLRHLDSAPAGMNYAKNLVYFPPNDTFYYIANGNAVFAVKLDRSDFSRSTITQVSGITGDIPTLPETGFAYDTANQLIGGGVNNSRFYAYDPLAKLWISRDIQPDPPGATIGQLAFHALAYSPVDNAYIFITDYNSGLHTWAYRFRNPSAQQPTLTFTATPATTAISGTATLSWSAQGADTCLAGGAWGGARATSGSETVGPLQSTATYTLTCNGAGGSAIGSATVTVTGGNALEQHVYLPAVRR